MFQFDMSYMHYKNRFSQESICKDTQDYLVF